MSADSTMPRVGAIGAGQWGRHLVANLAALGALAAVSELSEGLRADLAAAHPDLPIDADPAALLARRDLDAVVIATPVATHFALAREALLAGKDVFVEKPMTTDAREAEALVELAEARGRVLMVGHLLLYQPAMRWIKEALAAGLIGTLHALHQERLNLGRARAFENVLWSFGVHDVAVLLDVVGRPPVAVRATGQRILQAGVEDDVRLQLTFDAGVQAHLHVSWLWPERRRRLTAIGSAGMLVYDELAQTVTLHRKSITADLANRDEGSEIVYEGSGTPLELELRHFLACVANRQRPASDGRSGLAVIRVLEEAAHQMEESHATLLRA